MSEKMKLRAVDKGLWHKCRVEHNLGRANGNADYLSRYPKEGSGISDEERDIPISSVIATTIPPALGS